MHRIRHSGGSVCDCRPVPDRQPYNLKKMQLVTYVNSPMGVVWLVNYNIIETVLCIRLRMDYFLR